MATLGIVIIIMGVIWAIRAWGMLISIDKRVNELSHLTYGLKDEFENLREEIKNERKS